MAWDFWPLVDVVMPWIRGGRKARKSQNPPQTMRPRGLQIEPLEVRQMLNVAPIMPDLLVNSPGSHTPRLADTGNAAAAGPDGSFTVVYTSANQDGDGLGVFSQRFGANGTPAGGEFQVNVTTPGDQQRPSVAVDASGNAVYVWQSAGQDGSQTGVYGRRFSAAGVPLGGEFQVNVTTPDVQETPSVAFLPNGQSIVVWGGKGVGDISGVFGRRFDSAGNPLGGEFLINTHTAQEQKLPDVAALPDGGCLVVWQSHGNQDGSGTGIYAQRFDAGGLRVGGEFRVNTTTQSFQEYASIGVGKDGGFVIAWQSNLQDSSGYGIFAQRFDASGAPVGGEIAVNTTTADDQLNPSVAFNSKGGFAISWNGKGTGDNAGVFVREFDGNGVALGPEQRVNTPTDGTQRYATIVAASSGYAMVWSGAGATVSDGVFLRRLGSGPVSSGISDVKDWEDGPNRLVNLWTNFDDAENADSQLSYQVTGNTNAALFSQVSIDPATGKLTLDYAPNANGTAQLTVRATDPGGLSTEAHFTVDVAAVNDRPVALGLGNLTIAPGVHSSLVHVGEAFSDIDNTADQLTYELVGNTNPALFESTRMLGAGGALELVPAAEAFGEAVLAVRATDPGGLIAQQSFTVNILPGVRAVADQSEVLVRSGGSPKAVDLNAIFQNVDGTSAGLSYQVVSNSNPSLVTANLEMLQGVLQISAKLQANATAVIVVKARNAAGLWATHKLIVSASPTNMAPRIASLATGPDPTIEGALLRLDARGVVDDGTVAKVSFYRDTNGNGVLDPASDQLLGVDQDGSDGWNIDVPTAGFGPGAHRYFAQATDNLNLQGNAATVTGTIGKYAIADNDGPAYSEVGSGWTTVSASGDFLTTHRQHAAGTDGSKAVWTFGGLATASYKVCVTWSAQVGLASNAPFAIYDGTELLATVRVDQQVAPTDMQEDGTWWLDLGTYQIQYGQVRVELSNAADGPIAADAVRLVDPPTITSFTANSYDIVRGANLTLTAWGVLPSDGASVQGVAFYADVNQNGEWDANDEYVASATHDEYNNSWYALVSTANLLPGSQTFFAIANDDASAVSDPSSLTVSIMGASISGPTSVEAGSTYCLNLYAGPESVSSWAIDWGDGSSDSAGGGTTSASHVYQNGSTTCTIIATAVVNGVNESLTSINVNVLSPSTRPAGNTPPVAYDFSVTVSRNTTVTLWPFVYDADWDPTRISYNSQPIHGTLTVASVDYNMWTYTPNADFEGTDSFTYQVDDCYGTSNSATVTITVAPDQTTTLVSTSTSGNSQPNPSTYGDWVTFTATVSPAYWTGNTPSGSVDFYDTSTNSDLGSYSLDGNGAASFSTNSLSPGTHSITVSYSGDGNFYSSIGSISQQVQDQTTTLVSTSTSGNSQPNPSTYGDWVTFTATVSPAYWTGNTPSGSVDFYDTSTNSDLGSYSLDGNGAASFSTNSLSPGTHSITVSYSGDGNFYSSIGSISQQVQDQTTTLVSTSTSGNSQPNPSTYGDWVTFTATVSPAYWTGNTPSGSVDFYDTSTNSDLGSYSLDSYGVASFSTNNLGVGTHSITVSYSGDGNFYSSTGSISQQVQDNTTTSVSTSTSGTSQPNPSTYGDWVTFTATVSPAYWTGNTPSGSVDFYDTSTNSDLGSYSLDSYGAASFSTSSLIPGTHSITVSYSGDGNFYSSMGSISQQVQDQTTTVVSTSTSGTSQPNPSTYGDWVTFTATVSPAYWTGNTPSGSVDFYDASTSTDLGSYSLDGNGAASFSTSSLIPGTHSITVSYSGDGNFYSSSASISQQVQDQTTTLVSTSTSGNSQPNPSTYGDTVTFTATVSPAYWTGNTPSGSVDFYDTSTNSDLGNYSLDGNGVATFSTNSLGVGTHSITVSYSGDGNFYSSTGSISQQVQDQTTTLVSTSTSGNSQPNPSTYGDTVTFTATVSPFPKYPT